MEKRPRFNALKIKAKVYSKEAKEIVKEAAVSFLVILVLCYFASYLI